MSFKSLLPKQTKERGAISPAWPSALCKIGHFITERQVVTKADATVSSKKLGCYRVNFLAQYFPRWKGSREEKYTWEERYWGSCINELGGLDSECYQKFLGKAETEMVGSVLF